MKLMTFDRDAFYAALDRKRRAERVHWKDIATAAGVSASTFTRFGYGGNLSCESLVALLGWLGQTDLAPYMVAAEQGS